MATQLNLFGYMWEELTKQEMRVADLLCEGLSNDEIGFKLAISGNTIKKHLGSMYLRFGIIGGKDCPYDPRVRLATLLLYERFPHLRPNIRNVPIDWVLAKETNSTNTDTSAVHYKSRRRKPQSKSNLGITPEYIRRVLHLPSAKQPSI